MMCKQLIQKEKEDYLASNFGIETYCFGLAGAAIAYRSDRVHGESILRSIRHGQGSGVGWILALPWNQAPPEFRSMPLEHLKALSSDQPGVQAARAKLLVYGKERLCVLESWIQFNFAIRV